MFRQKIPYCPLGALQRDVTKHQIAGPGMIDN